jgi:hypothetical protein
MTVAAERRSNDAEWAALMESAESGDLRRVDVMQIVGNS